MLPFLCAFYDAAPLRLEITRLKEQLAGKEEAQKLLRQQMIEAQERLQLASHRHIQLTEIIAQLNQKNSAISQEHNCILEAKQTVEKETLGLKQRVNNLQLECSRLDADFAEANALHNSAESAIETQRAEQDIRTQALEKACKEQEAAIKKMLTQHKEATAKSARLEQRLKQVPFEKREKVAKIAERQKIRKGESQMMTELQGQASSLHRRLSAMQRRRKAAASLLMKAVHASGIENKSVGGGAAPGQKVSAQAELEAARERLAAQISQKKTEIARRAGKQAA